MIKMKKTIYLIGLICVLIVGMVSADELGEELVSDGDFPDIGTADCISWTRDGWFCDIGTDTAKLTATFGDWGSLTQTIELDSSKSYNVSLNIITYGSTQTLRIELGGINTTITQTTGDVSYIGSPLDSNILRMWGSDSFFGSVLTINSISVKEVLPPPPDVYEFNPRVTKNGETILAYEMVVKVSKVGWLIKILEKIFRMVG